MTAIRTARWQWSLPDRRYLAPAVALVGAALLVLGAWLKLYVLVGAGAVALVDGGLRVWLRRRTRAAAGGVSNGPSPAVARTPATSAAAAIDADDLVRQMLAQDRYALLLRPEIIANLSAAEIELAWSRLQDAMALVPEGEMLIGSSLAPTSAENGAALSPPPGTILRVERYYLDRYPVTNRQYYEFVSRGGYEQMSIWEPAIWPGVLDFVDRTGLPGPRFWQNGQFAPQTDDLPVTGVSWYEAAAYARWVGKRLPTDPEWEKAGSWPVQLTASQRPHRKFPWGDVMDRNRCNLWGSGPGRVVAVGEFAEGVSVGGVYQLVGNVWEWTTGTFESWCAPGVDLSLVAPLKVIRGGAFDTYFETQATCQFRSGEDPIARRHNVGFRCALSACDLAVAFNGLAAARALDETATDARHGDQARAGVERDSRPGSEGSETLPEHFAHEVGV